MGTTSIPFSIDWILTEEGRESQTPPPQSLRPKCEINDSDRYYNYGRFSIIKYKWLQRCTSSGKFSSSSSTNPSESCPPSPLHAARSTTCCECHRHSTTSDDYSGNISTTFFDSPTYEDDDVFENDRVTMTPIGCRKNLDLSESLPSPPSNCIKMKDTATQQRRRNRTIFTKNQAAELERVFQTTRYPDLKCRHEISKVTKLSENRIQVWFQNRRAKWRRTEKSWGEGSVMAKYGLYGAMVRHSLKARRASSDVQPPTVVCE